MSDLASISDNGFALVPALFSGADMKPLFAWMEGPDRQRSRAGIRHALASPTIEAIAKDTRLLDIASAVLSAPAQPFRATIFDKSQTSNWLVVWHQDTALPLRCRKEVAGWGPWSRKAGIEYAHAPAHALGRVVALRLHLDDSGTDNGPLRVIPGTHRMGVLQDDEVSSLAARSQGIDCLMERGGVIVMRPLLVHASSKSTTRAPRRVLHIEYADSLSIGDGLELAIA